jgi:hypothetical protein
VHATQVTDWKLELLENDFLEGALGKFPRLGRKTMIERSGDIPVKRQAQLLDLRVMGRIGMEMIGRKPRTSIPAPISGQPQNSVLEVAGTLIPDFCLEALQEELGKYGKPEIFSTGQASQVYPRGVGRPAQVAGVSRPMPSGTAASGAREHPSISRCYHRTAMSDRRASLVPKNARVVTECQGERLRIRLCGAGGRKRPPGGTSIVAQTLAYEAWVRHPDRYATGLLSPQGQRGTGIRRDASTFRRLCR